MDKDARTGTQLRVALIEVRESVAQTKGATGTMKTIDAALASGDAEAMRAALIQFDMLSTQQIQIMRKLDNENMEE